MKNSRRKFLTGGASAVAAGVVGASLGGCNDDKDQAPVGQETAKAMIGACGLACAVCPLMKADKCKGCASGKEASDEMVEKKGCAVLKCTAMKKVDYCGSCKMFTQCKKLIGKPYDQTFIDMMAKKMA